MPKTKDKLSKEGRRMSPAAKHDAKWVIGIAGATLSILVVVITATAGITTRFNQNDLEHTVIRSDVRSEVNRSVNIDNSRSIELEKINDKLDDLNGKQIQVMTNQCTILKAIEKNGS